MLLHLSKIFIKNVVVVTLPTLGLGLSTISKPLISRAQFSCSKAAHGTVSDIVWMNPAITSKGASAVSRSSLSDWEIRRNAEVILAHAESVFELKTFTCTFWNKYTSTKNIYIPIYPMALVQVIQCLDRDLNWAAPSSASLEESFQGTDAEGTCRPAFWWTQKMAKA